MDDLRRARFIAWFQGKPLRGDRKKLMDATGRTKGRVAQYFKTDIPFGERAAREIARAFDLGDQFFETDRPGAPPSQAPEASTPEGGASKGGRRSRKLDQDALSDEAVLLARRLDALTEPRLSRAIALIDMTIRNFEDEQAEAFASTTPRQPNA